MIMSEKITGRAESYYFSTTSSSPIDNLPNDYTSGPSTGGMIDGSHDLNRTFDEEAANDDFTSESGLNDYDSLPFSSHLGFDFTTQENTASGHETASRPDTMPSRRIEGQNELSLTVATGRLPSAPAPTSTSVPEFLYQLTKMLTENNNDVIEWSHGRIEVHSPHRLESDVLKKYFRHSKFASFQRQLNYFGFRKLAGKGKMAPCSYVNDSAMNDISSLFHIKRKSGPDPTDNSTKKKKDRPAKLSGPSNTTSKVNPVLAGIYNRTSQQFRSEQQNSSGVNTVTRSQGQGTNTTTTSITVPSPLISLGNPSEQAGGRLGAHHELARRAVGIGIRHGLIGSASNSSLAAPTPVLTTSTSTANSLSELASNYQNSLKEDIVTEESDDDPTPLSRMQSRIISSFDTMLEPAYVGFLSRNSSLIDLAMLAPVEENSGDLSSGGEDNGNQGRGSYEFLDFPNP